MVKKTRELSPSVNLHHHESLRFTISSPIHMNHFEIYNCEIHILVFFSIIQSPNLYVDLDIPGLSHKLLLPAKVLINYKSRGNVVHYIYEIFSLDLSRCC